MTNEPIRWRDSTLRPWVGSEAVRPMRFRAGDTLSDGQGNRVRVVKVEPEDAPDDYTGPFTLTTEPA